MSGRNSGRRIGRKNGRNFGRNFLGIFVLLPIYHSMSWHDSCGLKSQNFISASFWGLGVPNKSLFLLSRAWEFMRAAASEICCSRTKFATLIAWYNPRIPGLPLNRYGKEQPCPSFPWSFRRDQGKPQKHQGFSYLANP